MSQSGYTPILIYGSGTASNVPLAANLTSSASGVELALNYADMKLYAKNSAGVGTLLSSASGALGSVTSVAATVPSFLSISGSPITSSGTLAITLSGTSLPTTSGGTGLTSFTANGVVFANSTSSLTTGTALTFDGANFGIGVATATQKLHISGASSANIYGRWSNGTQELYAGISSSNTILLGSLSNDPVLFYANSSERMRIDTSGRLLVGGTSASGSSYIQAIQTSDNAALGSVYGIAAVRFSNDSRLALGYTSVNDAWNISATYNSTGAYKPLAFCTSDTERMRLDSAGNVGIGTSSPTYKFVVSAAGASGIEFGPAYSGTSNLIQSYNRSGAAYVNTVYDAANHVYNISGSEGMRLTSTGLGIGTSSPSERLHIYGASPYLLLQGSEASAQTLYMRESAGGLYFGQYGIGTRMLLDSSGNLGLGVTPSASTLPTIQSTYGVLSGNSNISIVCNAYYNSGFKYTATGAATYYQHDAGAHKWYNAPSGTAGNPITFTQAMTLDASGNLLVGTTSTFPSGQGRLVVGSGASTEGLTIYSGASSSGSLYFAKSTSGGGSYQGYIQYNQSNNNMTFGVSAGAASMTLDASGNLLVGTTSGITSGGVVVQPVSGQSTIYIGHITGTGSGASYSEFYYAGTKIGSITQTGTTAVLYNTTSDQRLKENIVDAPEFGSVIDSIKVRSYDWKADHTHQRAGFIAQELVTVAPEAVHQPVNEEDMMAVDYSKLVPMLVKEIQSLRKRLADAGIA